MDETTPLIPALPLDTSKNNKLKNNLIHHDEPKTATDNKSKSTSAFSQAFYFSTPSSRPTPPPVADDEEDEEEQVAFLKSDDDAEDSEEEEDHELNNSDHHVTFAFEDEDDEEEDMSYEEHDDDESDEASENGGDHEQGKDKSLRVPQDQRVMTATSSSSLIDFPSKDSIGMEQATPSTTTKPKQRKVNQRVRKNKSHPSNHSSYNAVSTPRSTPNTARRVRSHSFDTTNTGFTQNTVLSEAIASVISHAKDAIVEGISEVTHAVSDVMHEEIKPVTPRPEGQHQQKLSAIALAVLVFYKVSGGPFGCEPAVRSAGNFWALIGFIFFPFVWALQEALVTAELGSAFPEPSGCKNNSDCVCVFCICSFANDYFLTS